MHIACSCDARFAPDCGVMLASLLAASRNEEVHVHLLRDASLPDRDLEALRQVVAGHPGDATLHVLDGAAERVQTLARSDRFPPAIWYRVLVAELLPDLPRVLYLDADTLINAPLTDLWRTDLEGHALGAVTNPLFPEMVPRIRSELGLPDGSSYFNSGVLLLDLELWRADEISAQVLHFAERHRHLIWPDQDALNAVLHTRRLHLHPRWNAMPGLWELPPSFMPYPPDQAQEARHDPAIVHFVGPHKPWHYRSRHPFGPEYFSHLARTPWRGRPIEGRTARNVLLRRLPWLWAYRLEVAADRWPRSAREHWWRARGAAGHTARAAQARLTRGGR